jgi:hypothetical protein
MDMDLGRFLSYQGLRHVRGSDTPKINRSQTYNPYPPTHPHQDENRSVSESWFYKWNHRSRQSAPSEQRRVELDAAVAEAFEAAHGLHGSPRILVDVRAAGWTVSEKTVAKSMAARDW